MTELKSCLYPGLDHIANFINALDSEGMTANEVRSAIYTECLEPQHRAPAAPAEAEQAFILAASKIERNVLLHELTPDEMRSLIDAVLATRTPAASVEAGEVWKAACGAYEDGAAEDESLPMRDMVLAGDVAATAIISKALKAAEARGAENERAKVVAWLRAMANAYRKAMEKIGHSLVLEASVAAADTAATAIETGAHNG